MLNEPSALFLRHKKGKNLSFIYNISFTADTVHHASLRPAPLQTQMLTFTKSRAERCLTRRDALCKGQGEEGTGWDELKAFLPAAVISAAPAQAGTSMEMHCPTQGFLRMLCWKEG